MTPVGFEPTQFARVELEPTPLDHSSKVACPKFWSKHLGLTFSFKAMNTEQALVLDRRSEDTRGQHAQVIQLAEKVLLWPQSGPTGHTPRGRSSRGLMDKAPLP